MLLPDCVKLEVGRVVKTHGVKGEMAVTLDPDFDMELNPGSPVIFEMNGLDVPFFVGAVRPRGADSILLTLDEIGSETEAAAMVGKSCFVYADKEACGSGYDDDDELTADRLVGYTIVDGDMTVGRIADVREIGPDCWYFLLEDSGALIPIADELIESVDADARVLAMNLPAGLLDL